MNKLQHAIIMAAGRGIRMMPLTDVVPKAMVPFQGSTIIANGIKRINQHIKHTYITVGYKGSILAEHVIDMGVDAVFNTSGKGNSWWLYNTLIKHIDEPVVVLTCDNVIELDFDKLLEEYDKFNQPACMIIPVKPIPGLEGDYIFHHNNVVKKIDRHKASDSYCSGIQVVNPFQINQHTKNVEDFNDVWEQLIEQGQVYSSNIYPERWFAVDTVEQLNKLNNLLKS
jgi:NDP-sugar pyrophosphorylase family protein